jgi:hypothetical protein
MVVWEDEGCEAFPYPDLPGVIFHRVHLKKIKKIPINKRTLRR